MDDYAEGARARFELYQSKGQVPEEEVPELKELLECWILVHNTVREAGWAAVRVMDDDTIQQAAGAYYVLPSWVLYVEPNFSDAIRSEAIKRRVELPRFLSRFSQYNWS